jgi:hypothetical protein
MHIVVNRDGLEAGEDPKGFLQKGVEPDCDASRPEHICLRIICTWSASSLGYTILLYARI